MSILEQQRERLRQLVEQGIADAGRDAGWDIPMPEVQFEIPRDKSHGDFACNTAMVLARPLKQAPRQIAEAIAAAIPEDSLLETVQVAGPGFINFYLSSRWLADVIINIEQQQDSYGTCTVGAGRKVLLEYVSANPVGPMNVVNARAAVVGDTLARLLAATGFSVAREYYVNDAGYQADVFGRSVYARCLEQLGQDVDFPPDGYHAAYVKELAVQLLAEHPTFAALSLEEQQRLCRTEGVKTMVDKQRQDLAAFHVAFDRWFFESELHASEAVAECVQSLEEKGLLYHADGALWFRSTQFGDDKDRVLIKADKAYTYVTADIAYHRDKLGRGFDHLIDILGPDHHGYIGRMQAAVQALGYPAEVLEVIILQYVALLRDGQPVKMSKRAGEFVTMRELVDEVGTDAARYFFLMRSPESHLEFDLTLAVEQSNDNPVFYVQYAHARMASIFRQAEEAGIAVPAADDAALERLNQDWECDLIRKLAEFPDEVCLAAERREPHRIARYALELAGLFHSFYSHCHVLGEDAELTTARLALVQSVQTVLRRTLDLLGITAPERM